MMTCNINRANGQNYLPNTTADTTAQTTFPWQQTTPAATTTTTAPWQQTPWQQTPWQQEATTPATVTQPTRIIPGGQPGANAPSAGMQFPPEPRMLPETLAEPIYTPGYLVNQIGRLMRVEFLVGSAMTDRVGILREVGASYIVLDSLERNSKIMCDLFSIKFVTIIDSALGEALMTSF